MKVVKTGLARSLPLRNSCKNAYQLLKVRYNEDKRCSWPGSLSICAIIDLRPSYEVGSQLRLGCKARKNFCKLLVLPRAEKTMSVVSRPPVQSCIGACPAVVVGVEEPPLTPGILAEMLHWKAAFFCERSGASDRLMAS